MEIMSPMQARGHMVNMNMTRPGHVMGSRAPQQEKTGTDFASLLGKGIDAVNNSQQEYSRVLLRSVTDPDSVDSHDVTIAAAEANMTINMAKSIVDRVIRAYTDITNLR
ncbi:MAG: flagellar hook-basal body complex protein FliE [Spirochaetia bacterium]